VDLQLTDWDVTVLGKICDSQQSLLSNRWRFSSEWSEQVGHVWIDWNRTLGISDAEHLKVRSALARLQSAGFVAEVQTNFVKDGSLARQAFGLLPDGLKFCKRLQDINAPGQL
jgi:hypothetical protein